MTYTFLEILTDEQVFAIFESVVRARLKNLDQGTTAHQAELGREEHQFASALVDRGRGSEVLALQKRLYDEAVAGWQRSSLSVG